MLIFGDALALEPFKIPPLLYGDFSVFGVGYDCLKAIDYTYQQLSQSKRVENLVLIHPKTLPAKNHLMQIRHFGSKIYCFIAIADFRNLHNFTSLRQAGLVFYYKTKIIKAP